MQGTVLSIARLDSGVATVLLCVVANEKQGAYSQKEYTDTYERIAVTAIRQLIRNVTEFVRY